MKEMEVRSWKKVFETDLENIVLELKEIVQSPCVIVLSGPVGAGKTTFTRSFVGEDENVSSPTYSVINEFGNIVHADFYRIKSEDELVHLELPLYLEDKDYFLVEWGIDYLHQVKRFVSEDFLFYELKIDINEKKDTGVSASRNFSLSELKD